MIKEAKILKKGETGWGYLIESDSGFINPLEPRNQGFINEIKKLESGVSLGSMSDPLIVYVLLQKYGVLNRNGRIYPEQILKQQNLVYQQAIKDRNAIGECVPKETQIFTKNGWVDIDTVIEGDEIFTFNLESNKLEVQPISKTIKKHYDDDLIRVYNESGLDMTITKNHKVILWDRTNKPYILTGEELYNKILNRDSRVSHSHIKHSGVWDGDDSEFFTIPDTDITIKTEDWAAFLGIFISEGHTDGSKGGKNKNRVTITQVKSKQQNLIKELLEKLPFNFKLYGDRQFTVTNEKLHNHLKVLGDSHNKFIPEYAKNWSPRLLNILLKWLLICDGKNSSSSKGILIKEYCTTSTKLKDDVLEVMLKIGSGATCNKIIPKDRLIYDIKKEFIETEVDGELVLTKVNKRVPRLIKASNSKELNIIRERTGKGIYLDNRFTKVELIPHNDFVYCVSVPNKTWLMKQNNKIVWTHNCNHPEDSVISLDRVSHNIIETWWEGNALMGKMEIIMTPGFINYGIVSTKGDDVANLLRNKIKIGVSSRGIGSLKEVKGQNIVQDDFEIICWDIVSTPSTPGAYIFNEKPMNSSIREDVSDNKNKVLIENLNKFLLK